MNYTEGHSRTSVIIQGPDQTIKEWLWHQLPNGNGEELFNTIQ